MNTHNRRIYFPHKIYDNTSINDTNVVKIKELHIHQSRRASIAEWVFTAFPVFFVFTLALVFGGTLLYTITKQNVIIFIALGLIISGLLFLLLTGYMSKMNWKSRKFVVTPQKVLIVNGVMSSRQTSHSLKGYTSMRLKQSFVNRRFNSGTITLYFMGGAAVDLENIRDPIRHMMLISEMIENGYISEHSTLNIDDKIQG